MSASPEPGRAAGALALLAVAIFWPACQPPAQPAAAPAPPSAGEAAPRHVLGGQSLAPEGAAAGRWTAAAEAAAGDEARLRLASLRVASAAGHWRAATADWSAAARDLDLVDCALSLAGGAELVAPAGRWRPDDGRLRLAGPVRVSLLGWCLEAGGAELQPGDGDLRLEGGVHGRRGLGRPEAAPAPSAGRARRPSAAAGGSRGEGAAGPDASLLPF